MSRPRRILVIYTGGTLGMVRGPRGYEPSPGRLARELSRIPRLHAPDAPLLTLPDDGTGASCAYDVVEHDPLVDSANMGPDHWVRIAREVRDHDDTHDAFVVVHGTDTMAYTASALSFMLVDLAKPVILTGSQIPLAEPRTDAIDNLLGALTLAARWDIPEVGLYFRGRLLRGNRATKVDATGFDAFASPNLPPLATMHHDVRVAWDLVRAPSVDPLRVRPITHEHVACVQMFPGMSGDTLDRILQPPLQGVVLLTYGAGNAPDDRPDILKALRRASDDGLVVVSITQCLTGSVTPDYATGRALADAGVIGGRDMTAEAALTKLAYLLSLPELDPAKVRTFLPVDLRGELTPPAAASPTSLRERHFVDTVASVLGGAPGDAVGHALYPVLMAAAARDGDLDALARMLAAGADPGAGDADRRTPLHVAAAEGRAAVVTWLLARGADPDATDRWGRTPRDEARAAAHLDVLAALERREGG